MSNEELLLTGNIKKIAWKFAMPSIISMMVFSLYNIVDRVFIGNIPGAGALAMAGVGITMPAVTFMFALVLLIGVGAGTHISIKLGAGEKETANKLLDNSIKLSAISALLVMLIIWLFLEPILRVLGTDNSILPFAKEYLGIITGGFLFQALSFILVSALRSAGQPKMATTSNVVGTILNIILDALLVFGWGWGVAGAAWATIISQLVGLMIVVAFFIKNRGTLPIKLVWPNFKIDKKLTLMVVKIGASPGVMQLTNSLVIVLLNNVLLKYGGNNGIASLTILQGVQNLVYLPIIGYCQGQQPIIGFNYGAKLWTRVTKIIKYAFKVVSLFAIVAFFIGVLGAEMISKLFTTDPELIMMTTKGIRISMLMAFLVGGQILMTNYFQYIGKAREAVILSLLRQVIILLPLIYLMSRWWGLNGVWMAWPATDVLATVVTVLIFLKDYRKIPATDEAVFDKEKLAKIKNKVILREKSPEAEIMEESSGI